MMQLETKKLGKRKRNIVIAAILLIFILALLYFQLWKSPNLVDSGIAKHQLTFTGHSGIVFEVMFSPDGELLASGSVDNTVSVWQKKDGKILRTLQHPSGVTALAFSPDGKYLATGSYDSNVRLWRVADSALLKTFSGSSKTIWTVA